MTKGAYPFFVPIALKPWWSKYQIEPSGTAFFFHTGYSGQNTACAFFPPWCKEASMEVYVSERRISPRHL